MDEEDDVDDGDELAENLYPGVQMVEPRDLLLPVSAPQPFDEIKDISFKQPLQPRKQLEAITPLSPKRNENLDGPKETETPMNTQTSEGEDSDVTMSNQTTTPKEQKEPSVQKGQTGGVKRKSFGTPTRTQASRRTKTEASLFKRSTSPPVNPKQTKTLKKSESKLSLIDLAKRMVSTALPTTTSDSDDTNKPECSKTEGGQTKIDVDQRFIQKGYEIDTNSSDDSDLNGVQRLQQECQTNSCNNPESDLATNKESPLFARAIRNMKLLPNNGSTYVPCQTKGDFEPDTFFTFSECPTLANKGLITRPVLIPALEKHGFDLKVINTSARSFEIKRGQRLAFINLVKVL